MKKYISTIAKIATLTSAIWLMSGCNNLKENEGLESIVLDLSRQVKINPKISSSQDTKKVIRYFYSSRGKDKYQFDFAFRENKPYFWSYVGKVQGTTDEIIMLDFIDTPQIDTYVLNGQPQQEAFNENALKTAKKVLKTVQKNIQ